MSYGVKYILNAKSKNELNYIIEISERDYTGGSTNIPLGANPFTLNYYSQEDDVFNPIVGSELNFEMDITDFGNILDFYSDDDLKYIVKLYASTGVFAYYDFLIWQGFLLVDQSSIPFTTGLKFIAFKAVDGLGLLKDITFNPDIVIPTTDADLMNLKDVVLKCLNQIGLPDLFYFNVQCSIFADGMEDRGDSPLNEPLSQSFLQIRNWLKEPFIYKSCYDVLSEICMGFGCQIFQSNGQYVFSQLNEKFDENVYLTKYDNNGITISGGLYKNVFKVQGYGLTANMHWIDNGQTKVIKKGFNKLVIIEDMVYPVNLFVNENVYNEHLGSIVGWEVNGADFTTTKEIYLGFECRKLTYNRAISQSICNLTSNMGSKLKIFKNEIYTLSFDFLITPEISGLSSFALWIGATDGVDLYGVNLDTKAWGNFSWQEVTVNGDEVWGSVSYEMQPAPITGEFFIYVSLGVGGGLGVFNTKETLRVKNFQLKGTNNEKQKIQSVEVTGERGSNNNYKKEVSITLGSIPVQSNNMITGVLQDASNNVLTGWYRYGIVGTFDSLQKLLVQNYMNATAKNSITVQGKIYNVYAKKKNETTKNNLEYLSSYEVEDNAGDPLTVSGKRYVNANCNFNFIDNSIDVNLLETGNIDVAVTITEEIIYK
jgi:hypothetical protein